MNLVEEGFKECERCDDKHIIGSIWGSDGESLDNNRYYICNGVVYLVEKESSEEPGFYSASSKCPACNGADVSVKYMDVGMTMKRVCALCGYMWHERPLFENKVPLVVTTEACDSCAALELYEQQFQEE